MPTPVTSGTYNFQPTALYVLTEAFKKIGYLVAESPLDASQVSDGLIALQVVSSRWSKDDIQLWSQYARLYF